MIIKIIFWCWTRVFSKNFNSLNFCASLCKELLLLFSRKIWRCISQWTSVSLATISKKLTLFAVWNMNVGVCSKILGFASKETFEKNPVNLRAIWFNFPWKLQGLTFPRHTNKCWIWFSLKIGVEVSVTALNTCRQAFAYAKTDSKGKASLRRRHFFKYSLLACLFGSIFYLSPWLWVSWRVCLIVHT